MPCVQVERCSFHYLFIPAEESNGVENEITTIDNDFPLIVAPSGWCCDISFHRILHRKEFSGFNRLLIDQRGIKKTKIEQMFGFFEHDNFTAAADIMFICIKLKLPPFHFYAIEGFMLNIGIALITLFPNQVRSLISVCTIDPTGERVDRVNSPGEEFEIANFLELCVSEDDIFEVIQAVIGVIVDDTEIERNDEFVAYFIGYFSSSAPEMLSMLHVYFLHLSRDPKIELALVQAIQQPILIFHGDNDKWFNLEKLNPVLEMYSSSIDLEYHVLPGATHAAFLYEKWDNEIIKYLIPFLNKNSKKKIGFIKTNLNYALQRVALITGDLSIITNRNCECPSSFTALTDEERHRTGESIKRINERKITPNHFGDPDWKWSNRNVPPTSVTSTPSSILPISNTSILTSIAINTIVEETIEYSDEGLEDDAKLAFQYIDEFKIL